jgi:hypothetical protein
MKIGLLQVDGKLPNLALMKIAAFHKKAGDEVEWWLGPLFRYDKIYVSKIFEYSDLPELPSNAIIGGTGIDWKNRLPDEIDSVDPGDAWWLYPKFNRHLGFSELGCRFKCSFCCVPQKEGKPREASSIKPLLTNPNGGNRLNLLDDDFFGQPEWEKKCKEIISLGLKISFSQGLNIRLITKPQAEYISQMKFQNINFTSKQVSFAWDVYRDKKAIEKGFQRCLDAGIKASQMQFFVLIGYDSTPEQDMERVQLLKSWGCDPFVMAFNRGDLYQRRFQRWVNHRAIFKTVNFKEYSG